MALNPVSGPLWGLFPRSILPGVDSAAKLVYPSRPDGWPRGGCVLEGAVIGIWNLNLRDRYPHIKGTIVWDGSGGKKVRYESSQGPGLAVGSF